MSNRSSNVAFATNVFGLGEVADGFALPTQTPTAAWLCNWLKIYSAASLLQNRLLCVVVGAN